LMMSAPAKFLKVVLEHRYLMRMICPKKIKIKKEA